MAKSTAQRQADYRARRATAGENGDRRINTWVSTGAALALARLAQHHGLSQRDMLERLLIEADEGIARGLDPEADAWAAYFEVSP